LTCKQTTDQSQLGNREKLQKNRDSFYLVI